eukprot:jgi/Orpsp1_1/1188636/evm.model.d7180000066220.1
MSYVQTVFITAANRGIGLAWATLFSKRGWEVIGTARDVAGATDLAKLGAKIVELDVSNPDSIFALADKLKDQKIDLLINNAGVYNDGNLEQITPDEMVRQFKVNCVGPLFVTRTLLPNLALGKNSRVVNITSRMGSIGDNGSGGYYAYRASKAALNAVAISLKNDTPYPVLQLHPGMVKSKMTNYEGDKTPDEAVACMIKVLDKYEQDPQSLNGKFIHRDGFELEW